MKVNLISIFITLNMMHKMTVMLNSDFSPSKERLHKKTTSKTPF